MREKLIEEKITTEIKPPQQDEEKPQGKPINDIMKKNYNIAKFFFFG